MRHFDVYDSPLSLTDNEKIFRVIFPWPLPERYCRWIVADLSYDFTAFSASSLLRQPFVLFNPQCICLCQDINEIPGNLHYRVFNFHRLYPLFSQQSLRNQLHVLAPTHCGKTGMFRGSANFGFGVSGVAIFILSIYGICYSINSPKPNGGKPSGEQLNQ